MVRFLICSAFVLVLAAGCSSGDVAQIPETPGGGETPAPANLQGKLESHAAGQPTLDMTAEEIEDSVTALEPKIGHVLHIGLNGVSVDTCVDECTLFSDAIDGELPTPMPVLEHNGIHVYKLHRADFSYYETSTTISPDGVENEIRHPVTVEELVLYGAWLDYSTFYVVSSRSCVDQGCSMEDHCCPTKIRMREDLKSSPVL